jgi:hypothetical protein
MSYRLHYGLLLTPLLAAFVAGCQRSSGTAVWIDQGEVAQLRKSLGEGAVGKAESATAAEPTGFATIRGTFTLVGTPPPRKTLAVNKDQDICMPGGKGAFSEELVVDANGGIKDVVIYCITKMPKDDPKWEHPDYAAAKAQPVVFDQKDCVFLTHLVAARSSQTIMVKNSDPKGHNANIIAKGKALSANILIPAGGSSNYVPGGESPEPFDVSCSIHPWMSAKMLTRDNPCFAVTKADGSFEIKNVPAGVPLEFKVWQESAKFIQTVKVNGTAAKWPKGKLTLKGNDVLQPGEQRTLEVTVDASLFAQ